MKLIPIRFSVLALAFAALISLTGLAQDSGQVLRMSVGYRTMKNQAPMSDETRKELAPRIESDARFAHRVNVGFAAIQDDAIALRVYERGVGWTEACGTGACAAAVAAVETGRAKRHTPIEVRLPGGSLVIEVGAPGEPVMMTGPARYVFDGVAPVSR